MLPICHVGGISIGPGHPLAIIAGPCVLESLDLGIRVAEHVREAAARAGLPAIFKASFDKANRSSIDSPRGPGLEQGLEWLARIRDRVAMPITTDVHDTAQAQAVGEVVDLIQIPAFLSRQTDLLDAAGRAAARHHRAVNVKKGQFMSPWEMIGPLAKLAHAGCANAMVTDRGTFFGYHRLVTDFIGLGELLELAADRSHGTGVPVCLDCTHATQQPGTGPVTGGSRRFAPLLARAGVAAGVHALFIECHPDPDNAMSDAATQIELDTLGPLIETVACIRRAIEPTL